jgi:hypothetical protein
MRISIVLLLVSLIFVSCKEPSKQSSFKQGAFDWVNPVLTTSALGTFPASKSLEFRDGWNFVGWDSLPGKNAYFPSNEQRLLVSLPHRLPIPNSNLWYSKRIKSMDGYLSINADDGSQCWINGIWVDQNDHGLFPIPTIQNDSLVVQIRVINDAASGGLKNVVFIGRNDWESHLLEIEQVKNDALIQAKSSLWNGGKKWANHGDFPIWFTEPVILGTDKEFIKIIWTGEPSESSGLYHCSDKLVLDNFTTATYHEGVYNALVPKQDLGFFQFQMDKTLSPIYSVKNQDGDYKLKIAVWADSQGGWTRFKDILSEVSNLSPDFTVGVGDLVADGGYHWQYAQLLQWLHPLNIPHYLFPGNHDYDGAYNDWIPINFKKYLKQNDEENYLFWKEGPCAFIGLDPNENFPVGIIEGSKQYEWFTSIINSPEWEDAKWKVVFIHHPPFSQGWTGYQGEKSIKSLLKPYWESGLIDVVVSGHTHDYERLILPTTNDHQTAFLILGGAGGGLEPENGEENYPQMDVLIRKHHFGWFEIEEGLLEFKAIDIEGNIIDSFVLKKEEKII